MRWVRTVVLPDPAPASTDDGLPEKRHAAELERVATASLMVTYGVGDCVAMQAVLPAARVLNSLGVGTPRPGATEGVRGAVGQQSGALR